MSYMISGNVLLVLYLLVFAAFVVTLLRLGFSGTKFIIKMLNEILNGPKAKKIKRGKKDKNFIFRLAEMIKQKEKSVKSSKTKGL